MGRIDDGVQLGNLIGDALEWSFPISHAVQDTSKGPHITFRADLWGEINKNKKSEKVFHYCTAVTKDCLDCLIDLVRVPLSVLFLAGMKCL